MPSVVKKSIEINRITPDFDKKSSPESIKLNSKMNSKEHYVNKLVVEFISSCMKIEKCS